VGSSWNLLAQRNSRRHSFFDGGLLPLPASVSCASDFGSICHRCSSPNLIHSKNSLISLFPREHLNTIRELNWAPEHLLASAYILEIESSSNDTPRGIPQNDPFDKNNHLHHVVTYWRRLAGITFRSPHHHVPFLTMSSDTGQQGV
jgi:hypothetical protein